MTGRASSNASPRRFASASGHRTIPGCGPIRVEIGAGELLDKITILAIKNERITDETKLGYIRREFAALQEARDRYLNAADLTDLERDLKTVNERLWDIEDEIRGCEAVEDFGDRFVALARSVYRLNDRRAELKRAVNHRTGSRLVEQKDFRWGAG